MAPLSSLIASIVFPSLPTSSEYLSSGTMSIALNVTGSVVFWPRCVLGLLLFVTELLSVEIVDGGTMRTTGGDADGGGMLEFRIPP